MSRTWVFGLIVVGAVVAWFGARTAVAVSPEAGRSFVIWFPVCFFFVAFLVLFVRGRSANRAMIEGSSHLSAGRVHAAMVLFEKARKIAPRSPGLQLNLGLAQLYLWRVTEAAELLELAANRGRMSVIDVRSLALPILALAMALLNKRERAASILDGLASLPAADSPYALLARCVLACRAGDWASAEDLVNRREVYQFGGFFRAFSEVLNAWAVFNLRGEKLRFNRVALYAEAGPDGLRKIWPELADFAEKSG